MRFLVTNDDGVDAPGIKALVDALEPFGSVTVVAPREELSCWGHRTTTNRPLRLEPLEDNWYVLDGSPVDCVRVALQSVAAEADFVVSGINSGGNLGMDVHPSGTVAAAREAALLDRPAMAISQYRARRGPTDWQRASRWARHSLERLLPNRPETGWFWNVNLPDPADPPAVADLVFCRLDPNPLPWQFEKNAEGLWCYTARYQDRPRLPGHDIDHCFGGSITASLLSAGLESRDSFPERLDPTQGG